MIARGFLPVCAHASYGTFRVLARANRIAFVRARAFANMLRALQLYPAYTVRAFARCWLYHIARACVRKSSGVFAS